MEFFIYNTIAKQKEIFKPIENGKVSLYTCGQTVYDFSHIGNFRNFRHLIDNKLKIFNSDRLISGLLNYNYDPYYLKTKII